MTTIQLVCLLLACSLALHLGTATGLLARRSGAGPSAALLAAGATVGGFLGLYFAAVSAYQ
ncbi:hypothetical protein ABZZ79_05540 [Streptomyces sp. NPDC006458]|uniref:hypothetical protein n=1 Tax=Streptomyces sp. NPDC006458 TaxID=3154302 RepID=UPI0033A7681E